LHKIISDSNATRPSCELAKPCEFLQCSLAEKKEQKTHAYLRSKERSLHEYCEKKKNKNKTKQKKKLTWIQFLHKQKAN